MKIAPTECQALIPYLQPGDRFRPTELVLGSALRSHGLKVLEMLWPAQLGLELEDIQRVRQTLTWVVSQMTIPAETEALVSMKLPQKTIVFVLAICKDRPATEQIGHMRQLKLDLIKNGEKRKRNQKFETTVECKKLQNQTTNSY